MREKEREQKKREKEKKGRKSEKWVWGENPYVRRE